ncbi:MAG: hypothetical protein P8J87_20180 [Verrucomicrobiales bacterium]|nr:hypothetical protein [Verrucomicrobiales bacterium]
MRSVLMMTAVWLFIFGGVAAVTGAEGVVKQRLPGKYELSYRGTLLKLKAVKSYHADGTYESSGSASILGIKRDLTHRGTWKYENGYLIYLLTESSTPKDAPVGVPMKFKVIEHDGEIMKYRNEKKDEDYTEKRIGDAGK